jgi:hypothetical protein
MLYLGSACVHRAAVYGNILKCTVLSYVAVSVHERSADLPLALIARKACVPAYCDTTICSSNMRGLLSLGIVEVQQLSI